MKNPITVMLVVAIILIGIGNINHAIVVKVAERNVYLDMVNSSVTIHSDGGGYGAGVFIENDVVLTAAHVLRVPNLTIKLTDGTTLRVEDFYIDEKEDVGFIFVDANEICTAKVSLSSNQIGDTVYLVGTPFDRNFVFTLSKGILSHLERNIYGWKNLLQTDAESGKGGSGGPLYNPEGDVIGICVTGVPCGTTLCESAESILEAYERCKNASNL